MGTAEVDFIFPPLSRLFWRRLRPSSLPVPPGGSPAGLGLLGLSTWAGSPPSDLVAQCGPCLVRVSLSVGRIEARSPLQLRAASRRLMSPGWSFESAVDWPSPSDGDGVVARLDAFLLEACLARQARLPSLAGQRFTLLRWPDLDGTEQAWTAAHHVAAALASAPGTTLGRLARQNLIPECRINALLWALWSSGCATPA